MAKITVKATKLEDASVSYISLVKRGANRIPFRVIKSDKQEKEMINIGNIFKSQKADKSTTTTKSGDKSAQVVGVVIEKTEHTAEVQTAIKEAGLELNFIEEGTDGTITFKATEEPLDRSELQVVKMSDDVVVLMKGFDPYANTMTFLEAANSQGFYPAMSNAFDALYTVTSKALRESSSPEEAVTKMTSVLGEFSSYVLDAAKQIPAVAFKADTSVVETLKAAKSKVMTEQEMKDKGWKDADIKAYLEKNKVAPVAKEEEVAEPAETSTEDVAKEPAETTEAPAPEVDIAAVVKASIEAALAPLAEGLTTVTAAVDAVTKQVSDMAEAQTTIASKVEEVESVAKSASDSMKGVIIGSVPADDTHRLTTTVKSVSDGDPRTGVFDTAYLRKSAGQR